MSESIRAAFREVALALMEWREPPVMSRREYERREGIEQEKREENAS